MNKIDLSRRQFINVSTAAAGLFALPGATNLVLGESARSAGLGMVPQMKKGGIPYVGMTDEGPFYPPGEISWLKDLTVAEGAGKTPEGTIMYLFGLILDSKGRPIEGATVEIWHADNNGRYKHPRAPEQGNLDSSFSYFGKVKTGNDGSYFFKSIVPRWYGLLGIKRANHVHIKIRHIDHGVLTTQMYFEGKDQDEIRSQDKIFQGHHNGDRLIVPKESPVKYSELPVKFEQDAVCCRYDLAFLF